MRTQCSMLLSNGTELEGYLLGAPVNSSGELVFTTGMVGYSEALTDPSYFGQILVFSYPLIGNYGVPSAEINPATGVPKGFESEKIHCSAAILSIDSPQTFHWSSVQSIDTWLKKQNVPAIAGIDTRHLTHLIRTHKKLYGCIRVKGSDNYRDLSGLSLQGEKFFDPQSRLVLPYVSRQEPMVLGQGKTRIGLIDCGVKWNIIRQLLAADCQVIICPWNSDFDQVECHGWVISNGPGDPTQTEDLPSKVANLLKGQRPILGICLGHQILALAAGAKTKRMPYGHRSHNQPVYKVGTRTGYITSQNHGYEVNADTIPDTWDIWFRNINDESVEGIRHKERPFYSVQFHPEAAGGPKDTGWILNDFVNEVAKSAN